LTRRLRCPSIDLHKICFQDCSFKRRIRALKEKLCDLYGMPVAMQAIKRDIDAAAVQNEDQVACEDGDVLFLGNPFESLSFSANGEDHLSGLLSISEAVTGLLADAESRAQEQAMQEITLNVVMPRLEKANTAKALPEQRCQVVVVVSARMAEVKEMAVVELDAEQDELELEFAGQTVPAGATVQMMNLADGDTLRLVPA